MKNDKIKNIIIIVLFSFCFIFTVNLFRYCDFDGGADSRVTGSIQLLTRQIRTALFILQNVNTVYSELVNERNNYRFIAEQLRTEIERTERINTELQENYNRLRKYQSETIETIRNIIESSNGIGEELDGFGTDLNGLERIIRAIQERAETEKN